MTSSQFYHLVEDICRQLTEDNYQQSFDKGVFVIREGQTKGLDRMTVWNALNCMHLGYAEDEDDLLKYSLVSDWLDSTAGRKRNPRDNISWQ